MSYANASRTPHSREAMATFSLSCLTSTSHSRGTRDSKQRALFLHGCRKEVMQATGVDFFDVGHEICNTLRRIEGAARLIEFDLNTNDWEPLIQHCARVSCRQKMIRGKCGAYLELDQSINFHLRNVSSRHLSGISGERQACCGSPRSSSKSGNDSNNQASARKRSSSHSGSAQ